VQKKLGVKEANKNRSKQATMMVFMNRLVEVTQEYRADLLNAGCPSEVIDHLPTKKNRLEEAKLQQELFKKERVLNTQKRIEKLNDLYRLMRPIQNVAQIIYADDHARLNQYRMPVSRPSASREEDDSETND
jgi:transposase